MNEKMINEIKTAWENGFGHGKILNHRKFKITKSQEFCITCYGITDIEILKKMKNKTGIEISRFAKINDFKYCG